jgi:hypothetical protein
LPKRRRARQRHGAANGTAGLGCGFPTGSDAPEDVELTIDGAVGLADREFPVRLSRASLWT